MTESTTQETKRSWIAPLVWFVVAGLGTVICAVIVGIAAADSESAGMAATYGVAFPLGFLWAGSLTAIAGNFFLKGPVRMGAPFGCGLLAGGAMLGSMVVFFVAIFPSL